MAMVQRVVVLVVGLGLVGASGVIDAAGGPDSAAADAGASVDASSSLDATRVRQLEPKAAGRVDAAIAATSRGDAEAPSFDVRRLSKAERREILGAEPTSTIDLQVSGPGDPDAYLELVSRGGHIDLRGGNARFHGAADVFRGPLRPAAYLVFKAEPQRRYLVECEATAAQASTVFAASDGDAVFEARAGDRVSLLYRGENAGEASERVTVVISADRPDWQLGGCELTSAPL
ncbi:MAG: hypothetical protein R3A79_14630 [Nannocystaceae bacterium]